MNASPVLRKAWDRLTLSLPLLVMLVLALGSWWLVRSMPDLWSAPRDKVVRKDPDYKLHEFVVKVFDAQGRLVREVLGDEGRHYPDTAGRPTGPGPSGGPRPAPPAHARSRLGRPRVGGACR